MAIQFVLTAAGKAALVNDQNTGTNALAITTIAIGTGTRAADGTETALLTQAAISNFIGNTDAATNEIVGSAAYTGTAAINATEVGIFAKIGSGAEFLLSYWSTSSGEIGFNKIAGQTGRLAVAIKFDTAPAASITFSNTALVTFSNTFVRLTDTPANIQSHLAVVGNTASNALEFSGNLASNQLYYYLPIIDSWLFYTYAQPAVNNRYDIAAVVPSQGKFSPIRNDSKATGFRDPFTNDKVIGLRRYPLCFIERPSTAVIRSGMKVRGVYHGIITSTLYLENPAKKGWVLDTAREKLDADGLYAAVYLSTIHKKIVLTCAPPPSGYKRCVGFIDEVIGGGVYKIFIDKNSPAMLPPYKVWSGNSNASRTINVSNWEGYTTLTASATVSSSKEGDPDTPLTIPIPIFFEGMPVKFTEEAGKSRKYLSLSYDKGNIKVTAHAVSGEEKHIPKLLSVWLS